MRRHLVIAIALVVSAVACAQKTARDHSTLKGISFGVDIPFECRDLPGAGVTLNVGFDRTYRMTGRWALGFYLTGGGGFWGEYKNLVTTTTFTLPFA